MSTRSRTLAVLTAFAAAATTAANAQTYTFTQTEMGRIVPARFATTTQALMADVELTVAPSIMPAAVATDAAETKTGVASDEISTWSALSTVDENGDEKEENESGFFGSTMGRASIVGLAGLAGASYFALRSDAALPTEQRLIDTGTIDVREAPGFTANPEPATFVLMATGLLGVGIVARRRRNS